jgi:hypothetical protein
MDTADAGMRLWTSRTRTVMVPNPATFTSVWSHHGLL